MVSHLQGKIFIKLQGTLIDLRPIIAMGNHTSFHGNGQTGFENVANVKVMEK